MKQNLIVFIAVIVLVGCSEHDETLEAYDKTPSSFSVEKLEAMSGGGFARAIESSMNPKINSNVNASSAATNLLILKELRIMNNKLDNCAQ